MPCRRKWSAAMYMIFCGAPAHLIGNGGCVKSAVPPRKALTHSQVYSAVSAR